MGHLMLSVKVSSATVMIVPSLESSECTDLWPESLHTGMNKYTLGKRFCQNVLTAHSIHSQLRLQIRLS